MATVIVLVAATITTAIVLYVDWMVKNEFDNLLTILGPIVFFIWIVLILALSWN